MRFHGVDMEGDYKSQIVIDASALVWDASDERRMVYDDTTKTIWVADDTEWKAMGTYNSIPENTVMWVYSNTAPNGWSLYSSSGDVLVAVEGGSTYTTGGSEQGSFTTPAHSHTMQSHVHTAIGQTDVRNASSTDDEPGDAWENHYHNINIATQGPTPNTTGIGGAVSGYRPRARVGILCTR